MRVLLPDQPPCLYFARPETPLSVIVREATRGRPWFPISDVSSLDRSFGPAWRTLLLRDAGDKVGALIVTPAAPSCARIAIVGPHRAGPTQEVTVTLRGSDWCWSRIMEATHRAPEVSFGRTVASQWGLKYVRAGRHRRSVSGLKRGRVVELDRVDGWPADWSNSTHLVCNFLAPSSGLRWTGGLTPLVVLWPSCCCFRVDRAGQLQELEWADDTLMHPKWLLFLRARRCWSERAAQWSTFLQLRDGSYCGLESGCTFQNEKELVAKSVCGKRKWRRALILLQAGDRLPVGSLPKDKDVSVFRRDGTEVTVQKGFIRMLNTQPDVEGSTWTTQFKWIRDEVAEEVSHAMRAHRW